MDSHSVHSTAFISLNSPTDFPSAMPLHDSNQQRDTCITLSMHEGWIAVRAIYLSTDFIFFVISILSIVLTRGTVSLKWSKRGPGVVFLLTQALPTFWEGKYFAPGNLSFLYFFGFPNLAWARLGPSLEKQFRLYWIVLWWIVLQGPVTLLPLRCEFSYNDDAA